ncbi:MAG TPA: tRNA pseudouridine(38-40) synthase TruA [Vicinamibacterales bacterium]|nr:tRNA pseudouridine(38-40) synthase TruA [Vicinamibacterales bacterium]
MTEAPQRTLKLTLAYEGTAFAGWQRQPGQRTVQAALEDALAAVDERPVTVVAAGRTDAGVHAFAQVASARVSTRLPPPVLIRALNVRLPGDVRITRVDEAPPGFDARRAARTKSYRYTVAQGADPGPFVRRVVWHVAQRLDVAAMMEAAAALEGEHDFAAFQAAGGDVKTSVRRLIRSRLTCVPGRSAYLSYDVTGTGFLRHMVRNIVGTLVDIGRGRWPASEMRDILASRSRRRAGMTAPPQGLVLVRVAY